MDITAVRLEIAGLVTGRQVYDYIPGAAQVPCVVVGLPEEIRWLEGIHGLKQALLPVWAIGGRPYEATSEATVLTIVDELVDVFRTSFHGTSWASLVVINVDRIGTIPIGQGEFVAGAVNLLLTSRP